MNDAIGLTVHFWGVRGSIPTPGRQTEKYGGNTACVEVRRRDKQGGETIIVLDAGSGIREMGLAWEAENANQDVNAFLLFSHFHWDHIQGFPFFGAAYRKGNKLSIYGQNQEGASLKELLGGQMQGAYFPIPLAAMQATLDFFPVPERFTLGPIDVRSFRLPHPGGCFGFRFEVDGNVLVYASDCELDQAALNSQEALQDLTVPRQFPPDLLGFFDGATLVIIDCQYPDDEYPQRIGWGHNSISAVIDLLRQVHVDMVALFHHDPQSTDDVVSAMTAAVLTGLQHYAHHPVVFAAREGLALRVAPPKRPPKV